ncbi:MAG: hypothetical protein IJZ12_04090, partial [Clostridia bacterium]|nr:hypothetical protein [Clostridia bacterium]
VTWYTLKDKVKIDGEKKAPSDVFDVLKDAAEVIDANAIADVTLSETDGYAQPIKYSVSGTAIEGIDTILEGEEAGSRGDDFTYDGQFNGTAGSTTTSKVTVGGDSFSVNSTTFVLYVPMDRGDEDSYSKMSASTAFAVTKNRYVEVFGYDGDVAKMVVVYGINPTLNFIGNSPYLIVTEKGGAGDNKQLRGYVNGNQSNDNGVVISENNFVTDIGNNANLVTYDDVEKGDIVRFIKDSKGEAVAIEMVYDKSEDVMYTTKIEQDIPVSKETQYISESEGSGADFIAVFGTIQKKRTGTEANDNKVEIVADKERIHKFNTNTKVFKLLTSGEVELSSMDEVYDGTDGMAASTVILITTSVSTEATAQTIYIIE